MTDEGAAPRRVSVTGVGRYLPERVLSNADLEQMVETSDEWIMERTGIRERRIAAPFESSSTMGAEAARQALVSAGLEADAIDLIVVGTSTPDGMFPAAAARIQHAIGATRAAAFDVNSACAGFLAALSTGSQFVAAGGAQRAMVIGAETMSRIVDWRDRGTCVLFGDGAGALVLEPAEAGRPGGFEATVLRSDGGLADLLWAGGPAAPVIEGPALEARIIMDGRNVFRQAVTAMSHTAAEAIAQAGLTIDDIALCVPHQANARIIDAIGRNLGLPAERVFVDLDHYGNTSSASIPIALSEAVEQGALRPGDHVLLVAFGGGLSWGAVVLEWAGVRVTPVVEAAVSMAEPASR
ncbi:MAG: beta-ketoacyl-ACP synthase III [Dehalococcoidia bacterium]